MSRAPLVLSLPARLLSLLAALLLLATSAWAGPRPRPEAPRGSVVVGHLASMTGSMASFGISANNGVLLATEERNAAGGIAGRPVALVLRDDQGKPAEVEPALRDLIARERPVAVLGEVASTLSLAAASVLQPEGIPLLSHTSTNPRVTQVGDYIFRACFIDPFQGEAMARFAFETKGLRRVAILEDASSAYASSLVQTFVEAFTALGGEIVGQETYAQGDFDYRAQLQVLLADGRAPDAIYVPGYYTNVGMIAVTARQMGYTGLLLGGDGWDSEYLLEIGGEAIVGGLSTNHVALDAPDPAVQAFVRGYQDRFGARPDGIAALAYDAARILFAALDEVARDPAMARALVERSRSPAAEKRRAQARAALRDSLARTTDFPGLMGPITLDAERNARRPAVILEVTPEGFRFVGLVPP